MSAYLLDTNHLSRLISADHPLHLRVLSEIDAAQVFTICTPILTETLFGIGILPRASQNLILWRRLQHHFTCYFIEESDGEMAAELQISLRKRGWQLDTVDALIASVALRYELVLLTTDKDFLAVPGLQMENWLR